MNTTVTIKAKINTDPHWPIGSEELNAELKEQIGGVLAALLNDFDTSNFEPEQPPLSIELERDGVVVPIEIDSSDLWCVLRQSWCEFDFLATRYAKAIELLGEMPSSKIGSELANRAVELLDEFDLYLSREFESRLHGYAPKKGGRRP